MSIVLYSMDGCGFCVKAEKMFGTAINSGWIVVKSSQEAPEGIRGFPTFEYKGKTVSGLPSSEDELFQKLGYIPKGPMRGDLPFIPHREGYSNNKGKNPLTNFIGVY